MQTWIENVKWRLTPSTTTRFKNPDLHLANATPAAARGEMIIQCLVGAYMYLRSLIGPEELLYAFHDQPELIHDCMRTWVEPADAVISVHQKVVTLDEIFFAEDICYNHGPLISPDMMKEFLIPYYQQVIHNVKRRQLDPTRHL